MTAPPTNHDETNTAQPGARRARAGRQPEELRTMKIADKVKEALAGADPVWANASAEMVQAILERAMQMTDQNWLIS
jgi:hypothetical protein